MCWFLPPCLWPVWNLSAQWVYIYISYRLKITDICLVEVFWMSFVPQWHNIFLCFPGFLCVLSGQQEETLSWYTRSMNLSFSCLHSGWLNLRGQSGGHITQRNLVEEKLFVIKHPSFSQDANKWGFRDDRIKYSMVHCSN